MRIALLTGAAALVLAGTAGARAETIYVAEPDTVIGPGYVYSEPNYVVSERSTIVVAAAGGYGARRESEGTRYREQA